MRIDIGVYSKRSFVSITVRHPGQPELNFDGGGYRNAKIVKQIDESGEDLPADLFNEVNEFIEIWLKKDEKDRLFDCYLRAEALFQSYDSMAMNGVLNGSVEISGLNLDENLREISNEIYELVRFEDLLDYVKGNRNLKIPPELSDSYITEDKITPAYVAKTYLLSEYKDLMALCLGLRFMIPIWGPYMGIQKGADNGTMKEYYSFGLIRNSSIYASRAFDRMDVYIRANISDKDQTMASTLHFLSSEEIPTYAIAITCIRKLAIAPLSCDGEKQHLMKTLYTYSTSRIRNLDSDLEPGLQDKSDRGAFVDDNSSVFCMFKMKEQLSVGELEYAQVYIENYIQAAKAIDPDIDVNKVELCVQRTLAIQNWKSHEVQKGLVAWTLSPIIVGSTVFLLNRKTLRYAMGIAQAVLWHWGLHELAIMVTGRVRKHEDDYFPAFTGKAKLSDNTLAVLNEIYPYQLAKRPTSLIPGGYSENAGVRGVEFFHKFLSTEDWDCQCPVELMAEYGNAKTTRFIEPSNNLREGLAELLIKLKSVVR